MTVKEYLRQIRSADSKINNEQKHLDMAKQNRTYLSAIAYDGDRVQTSTSGTGFTSESDRIVDIERQIDAHIDAFIALRARIVEQINELEYPYCELLFKRYVEYKSFEQIACDMCYSYVRVTHLHGEALQEFAHIHGIPQ